MHVQRTNGTASKTPAGVLTRLARLAEIMRSPTTGQSRYVCRFLLIVSPDHMHKGLSASWRH